MSRLASRAERSRQNRREAVRQQLLDALASQLERGTSLAAVKVEDLASEAGISRATFYVYFQDKVELLEEWLLETRATLFEVSNAWYAGPPPSSRAELTILVRAVFDGYRERLTLMAAMHEMTLYDETLREEFAEALELHFSALTDHIARGQRFGAIDRRLLARETAEWLVCLLERVPTQIDRRASGKELDLHLEAVVGVVWSTLYATGAQS
jgi:AcrR family transcriptional regulator